MADPAELIDHYRRAHFEVLYCQSSTNSDDKEAAQAWLEEANANLLAALTPPPTPDAVALVDELVLCVSMAAQAKSGAERENHKRSAKEARAALLAALSPAPTVPEGLVTVPKDALNALYMRLWQRHEHIEHGQQVHRPWTSEDDAALRGIAKYLFPAPPSAPEAPR
jgi:hypothetical protein